MYLKFYTRMEFPALARMLCPKLSEVDIGWDYENVYEWMYIDLPQLDLSLDVSREHGWANIDDDILDKHQDNQEALKQMVQPGSTYVEVWDRGRSDYAVQLPDFLPSFIADRLSVIVSVYNGRFNIGIPDRQPLTVVHPKHDTGS